MRTQGTFSDVYEAARDYYLAVAEDGKPMDAVVRRVGDVWMLESGIHPEPEANFELSLDHFDMYWSESYRDDGYIPTPRDATEFMELARV